MPSSSAKRHSLAVAFCRLNVGRLLTCSDFCEGPKCPGLVTTLVVLSGEIESTAREVGCVGHPICSETSLAEPGDPERIVDRSSDGAVLLHDLLQKIQAVGDTPDLGISVTEVRGHVGEPHRDVPVATEPEPTFEHDDRSSQVALAERHKASTEARADQAERVICPPRRFGAPRPRRRLLRGTRHAPQDSRPATRARERRESRPHQSARERDHRRASPCYASRGQSPGHSRPGPGKRGPDRK